MAKSETGKALEETVDAVDEGLEFLERIPRGYLNGTSTGQAYAILVITAAVGAAAGGFATYKFTRKKIRARYEELAQKEIEEARNYYRTLGKEDFKTPADAVDALVPGPEQLNIKVTELGYNEPEKVMGAEASEVDPDAEELHNIFTDAEVQVEFDLEAELLKRTEEAPYVISVQEYMEGEKGYEQETLTYFEGDDVLADSRDNMIEEVEATVGHDNLERFGHGSNDKNLVYIRNDRQELDMEIIRSQGDFAKEVLGFNEANLKHSDERRPRRMRRDDE